MNIIDYYPTAITHTPNINTDDVIALIKATPDEVHYVLSEGFNPVFLRTCFNEPNCRIIFFKADGIDDTTKETFVGETPPDRSKAEVIFLSADCTKEEMIACLNLGASLHVWNTDSNRCPSQTLVFLANTISFTDRIAINAQGYHAFLVGMLLETAVKARVYIRKSDNFTLTDIKTLIGKGKERVNILAEGFSDADLAELSGEGASIIASNLMV